MIKIIITTHDDSHTDVSAEMPEGKEPAQLIKGVYAHVRTISQILHTHPAKVLLAVTALTQMIEEHPDAMNIESVTINIPEQFIKNEGETK